MMGEVGAEGGISVEIDGTIEEDAPDDVEVPGEDGSGAEKGEKTMEDLVMLSLRNNIKEEVQIAGEDSRRGVMAMEFSTKGLHEVPVRGRHD